MNLYIKRAIEIAGSQASLARACGVTQPAVHRWLNGNRVKADYVMAIVEATNGAVQAHELRPDLPKVFPPPVEVDHEDY
ncbi:transcriptional regulator [Xenorhabdus vietnamensis]|uniref:transcriptional regulator n=1 Tax=Xenorhabdus vietnamensis TaxID=351656 RepID=UPI000A31EF92|nr:helix-turn-helix domain-containing protein [Xenorhabdus vietnamensis]